MFTRPFRATPSRSLRATTALAAAAVLPWLAVTGSAAGATTATTTAATTTVTTTRTTPSAPDLRNVFVRRVGDRLVLAGKPYTFAGSNNYYPMYNSHTVVDNLFTKAATSGFQVMRVWGSLEIGNQDGTNSVDGIHSGVYLQYWDPTTGHPAYNDGADGMERLDYLVAEAHNQGLRLVIPFVNNWSAFGGIDQYVRWAGDSNHDDFYTDPKIRQWYKDWISHVLNRTNSITGVKYKDDPTILLWELANEPRCKGSGVYPFTSSCTTDTIASWADDVSTYIKSIDRNALVGSGDEGFYATDPSSSDWTINGGEGVDSVKLAKLKNIDVLSLHLYPDSWGKDAAWGTAWITSHLQAAHKAGKPAFLGEFGWLDKSTRNTVYKSWTDAFLKAHGTGALYWLLSDAMDDGSIYPDYDGFTVYCPSPVCTTFGNFDQQLRGKATYFAPVADVDSAIVAFNTPAVVNVTANDVAWAGRTIRQKSLDLDPATAGVQTSVTQANGVFAITAAGTVTFTPVDGFVGKATVPYQVKDSSGRPSNVAGLTVTVKPDPGAAIKLFSFEDGVEGWAEQSWSQLGGTVAQTTDFATDGTHGLQVNSLNEWFGLDLPTAVDLSTKSTIKVDLKTNDVGTSAALVLKAGSSWSWCQGAFTWYPQGQTATVEVSLIDGLSCDGGAAPDLTQVHGVYLYFNTGTFDIDNVRAE